MAPSITRPASLLAAIAISKKYQARRHTPRIFSKRYNIPFKTSSNFASFNLDYSYTPVIRTILCVAATILLTLVSLSSPINDGVFFLGLSFDGIRYKFTERYGLWGYTKNAKPHIRVGYAFPGFVIEDNFYTHFTKVFVLHPIGALFAALAVLTTNCRSSPVLMSIFVATAAVVTLAAWITDMIIFTIVRDLYRTRNIAADYGNGLWLMLAALLALLMSLCMCNGGMRMGNKNNAIGCC